MMKEKKHKRRGIPLQIQLTALGVLLIIPFAVMSIYLLYNIHEIGRSYNRIVQNITQINQFNLVFEEEMDTVMYMMVAHSMSKYEVQPELGMTNPDVLIREAEEAFENVRATTVSNGALQSVKGATKLLITLHKRVNDISSTVKTTGYYDENMERLDLDIRVITEMIQERISQYIYYESKSMETIHAEMEERRAVLIRFSVLFSAVLIITSIFLSSGIARSVTGPIRNLVNASEQIGRGDFRARADDTKGSPEIRTLSTTFNSMAERIGDLVERNRQEQINLRNMELKLLQEQINPHFLYNTLDNIVWLAEDDRKEDVEGIAEALSTFFRTSLSGGRDVIRIAEEESHIRSYLEIQQFRYRDMLTYDIDIDPECRECMILKMTLQPVVENAIYHGIKNKRGGGHISIRIQRDGGRIKMLVSDTGIGMTEEQLTELVRRVDGLEAAGMGDEHFGLANVSERLRLNYGEAAGMVFRSEYGKGTEVEIYIPYSVKN